MRSILFPSTTGIISLEWAYGKAGNGNETEMKRKLEVETGNGNRKLKTEMETTSSLL